MPWTRSQIRAAAEPGAPLVLLVAMLLGRLFPNPGDTMLIGLYIGLATVVFWGFARLTSRPEGADRWFTLNPWYLPWAGVLGVVGAVLTLEGEPWKYLGFACATVGAAYLVLGGIAIVRRTGLPE
jgi:hypothetical protein